MCLTRIKVSSHTSRSLEKSKDFIKKDPGLRSVFVNNRTGEVFQLGDVYKHKVLGNTLRNIAENGAEEFYTGTTATNLVEDIQTAGEIITMENLASYKVGYLTQGTGCSLPHPLAVGQSWPQYSGYQAAMDPPHQTRTGPLSGTGLLRLASLPMLRGH